MEKVVKSSPDLRIRSSQRAQDETPYQMNGNGGTVCLLGQEGRREGGKMVEGEREFSRKKMGVFKQNKRGWTVVR